MLMFPLKNLACKGLMPTISIREMSLKNTPVKLLLILRVENELICQEDVAYLT